MVGCLFLKIGRLKNDLTCPVLLLPARLSSRPPPGTTSDEGAGRRKELSRRSRESLAAHLGARRGGAVRRSEQGRRINGVSELLLPRESVLMDLHHYLLRMMFLFPSLGSDVFVLSLKSVIV